MKEKFLKRILSAVTAAALAISTFAAIPAGAEETETPLAVTKTASVAAQVRAANADWTSKNSNSTKFITEGDMENTATANFGSFYYFDKLDLPENAIVDKVTITVNQGSATFSNKPFAVLHTENPDDISNIDNVFSVAADAKIKDMADATKSEVYAGKTIMTELTDENGTKTGARTESLELMGEAAIKYFNADDANSYFLYNIETTDTGKRPFLPDATLAVEYTIFDPSAPTSKTASVAAQLRGSDADWTEIKNKGTSTKFVTEGNMEITATAYFASFYYFDKIALPLDATVTKVKITIEHASGTTYSNPPFALVHAENPTDLTNIDNVFNTAKGAWIKAMNEETAAEVVAGEMKTEVLRDTEGNETGRTEVIEITDGDVLKYFNVHSANSYIVYNKTATDGQKRNLTPNATLEIEYRLPEYVCSVTANGQTASYAKYESLNDAVSAAQENDTVTLLEDAALTGPLDIETKISIDGSNKTITTANRIEYKGGGTFTIKNLTITGGGNLNIPGHHKIIADNITVDKLNNIGGNGTAEKGTISNSTIKAMTVYGNIALENTSVEEVIIPKIAASGTDIPKINADSSSVITKLSASGATIADDVELPYALMTGDLKAIGTVELPEGYEYDSATGEIKAEASNEETPNIAIDYVNEKLTGFDEGSYTIGGNAVTPADGELAIDDAWFNTTISIVKKGDGETTTDSEAQSLAIPARPAAPAAEDFTVTQPSTIGGTGTIAGITAAMEYKLSTADEWTDGTGEDITDIAGGTTYVVRKKAVSETSFKSGNYSIAIEAFGAEKEATPEIEIDYANEKLTGFDEGSYTIGGNAVTPTNGELAIDSTWFNTTILIVKKGNGTTTNDSEAQSLAIPARPAAPSGLDKTDETALDANDGTITGVDSTMEYKLSMADTWTEITGSTVTNLAPGEYAVRVKASASNFTGASATVTIGEFQAVVIPPVEKEETPNIAIDYVNEKLTGFGTGSYTIGGNAVTPTNGELAIDSTWFNTTLAIVKKGNGTTTNDSEAQSLLIPARPAAPSGLGKTDETAVDANDGTITGVDSTMEYKLSTADTWTEITGSAVTGLAPGEYAVRVKASASNFTGASATVTIGEFVYVPPVEDEAEIVIGKVINASPTSSVVDVTVNNPNDKTENGVLMAALYSGNKCIGFSFVNDGKASFDKAIDTGMTIKAFLWSAVVGENAMKPILPRVAKTI